MKNRELEIGEEFTYDDVELVVVKSPNISCTKCYFYDVAKGYERGCSGKGFVCGCLVRKDGNNVIAIRKDAI